MSKENITIQDCLDNYLMKGKVAVIEKGQVVEFKKEEERGEEL